MLRGVARILEPPSQIPIPCWPRRRAPPQRRGVAEPPRHRFGAAPSRRPPKRRLLASRGRTWNVAWASPVEPFGACAVPSKTLRSEKPLATVFARGRVVAEGFFARD